jgi:hypothetical protein
LLDVGRTRRTCLSGAGGLVDDNPVGTDLYFVAGGQLHIVLNPLPVDGQDGPRVPGLQPKLIRQAAEDGMDRRYTGIGELQAAGWAGSNEQGRIGQEFAYPRISPDGSDVQSRGPKLLGLLIHQGHQATPSEGSI